MNRPSLQHDNNNGGLPIHVQDEDDVILLGAKREQLQHCYSTFCRPVRTTEHLQDFKCKRILDCKGTRYLAQEGIEALRENPCSIPLNR